VAGLHPEGEARQSARFAIYEAAFDRLVAAGRLYRCYETAQELDLKRKVLLGRGLPPIYDRAALHLSEADHAARAAAGEKPHWRFLLDHDTPIAWHDGIRGPQHFDPRQMSDPVVRRADGSWLYMLPSAIDDAAMGISDVLRGEDHVSNTATQIQMFARWGRTAALRPRRAADRHRRQALQAAGFAGRRRSARGGDRARSPDRHAGAPGDVGPDRSDARCGCSGRRVRPSRFGRAPARFDDAELHRINAAVVHRLPFARVAHLLPEGMTEVAWEAIRPNLAHIGEAADWWRVVTGPITAPEADPETRAFLDQAATVAAGIDWASDPWSALTATLKDATGRKGKALFLPLRQALTGMDHGPDMKALLPLIGKAEAIGRLSPAS
jgi:glutamyl-tRNA synthetase